VPFPRDVDTIIRPVRASIWRLGSSFAFYSSTPNSDRGKPSMDQGRGALLGGGALGSIRWWRVLATGVGLGIVSYLLLYPVIIGYYLLLSLLNRDVQSSLVQFAREYGTWGMPTIHMLLAAFAASWVARKVGTAPVKHGVLTALVSVGVVQAIALYVSPPLDLGEAAAYLVMALGGGLLGGIEGWNVLVGQEALYQVSRDISAARDPRAVLAAIHGYLADPATIGVALWQAPVWREGSPNGSGPPAAKTPWFSWDWPDAVRFDRLEELAGPGGGPFQTLRPGKLSAPERAAWREQGVRSALLLPLVSPADQRIGLLAVASHRRSPPRSTVRACLTVGIQVALALENLRLVEEAREAGILRERQRMAHEIHDTLAQGFTSIVMNLEAAEGVMRPDSGRVQHHLDQARLTARESLAEARRLVWALRPEPLERASLPEALGRLAERWSKDSGIAAIVTTTGTPRPLPSEVETTLFRVAQEALANVRKHAKGASRVALTLSYMGDTVALDARDDGPGFDPARKVGEKRGRNPGGLGLKGMRERVERIGGTLSVESAPGDGSTLTVELPMIPSQSPRTKSAAPSSTRWRRRTEPATRGQE
jgi:signal transduction histidine kinase